MSTTADIRTTVVIVGGGVVGAAILHRLAHRGVDAVLLERDEDLAYAASGTNSGILHTGFDSTPGDLETAMILRSAALRPSVLPALGVPVLQCGALLVPRREEDRTVIAGLEEKAVANGVEVRIRPEDGALEVPGEHVTDPVAYTLALAASATAAGGRILRGAAVVGADARGDGVVVHVADGRRITAEVMVNSAGLHADDVARMLGDDSFRIYPRKGEFLVFAPPAGTRLDRILLPVPTTRTKGVLVFPTLDGRVVAGPTAVDGEDKTDWSVRPQADAEIVPKAVEQYPPLAGLEPVARYAGLRPAGRDVNYVVAASPASARLINVAAIRSTGLSASLGIGERVAELVAAAGPAVGPARETVPPPAAAASASPWWRRTAARLKSTA